MAESSLSIRVADHIAFLTLNRPASGNMINDALAIKLREACQSITRNDSIYAVLITGSGDSFCVGSETEYKVAEAVAAIEQPVIAVIHGDALAAGLELALACDIRFASKRARFALPQIANGAIPYDGGTQRLPRIVGRGKALELLLGAATLDAEEALAIGLVHHVLGEDKLTSEAEALARKLAAGAPIVMRYLKEAVNKGLDLNLEEGLRLEADLYFLLHTTRDRTEGVRAFLEKRNPQFTGE